MKDKLISSIMAGAYVALGALTYLLIPNAIVGTMFFSAGILLVFSFDRSLFTKVVPMSIITKEFTISDIIITWVGNLIGAVAIAVLSFYCRFQDKLLSTLQPIAEKKLHDTPLSLFIMGIFCAVLVSYAVFLGKRFKVGSFPHVFYVWLLITAFVFGGYDHIVSHFYYLATYILAFGFDPIAVLKVIFFVTAGNIVGGIAIATIEKKRVLDFLHSDSTNGGSEPKTLL